jgi:hypothetical protein
MLVGIAVVLMILWILGLVTSTTLGGAIHALVIVAVALLLVRAFQVRRA